MFEICSFIIEMLKKPLENFIICLVMPLGIIKHEAISIQFVKIDVEITFLSEKRQPKGKTKRLLDTLRILHAVLVMTT